MSRTVNGILQPQTPYDVEAVQRMVRSIQVYDPVLHKMAKSCNHFIAEARVQRSTCLDYMELDKRKKIKANRKQVQFPNAVIMNEEILLQREKADKEKQRIWQEKQDKQRAKRNDTEWQKAIKELHRLGPDLIGVSLLQMPSLTPARVPRTPKTPSTSIRHLFNIVPPLPLLSPLVKESFVVILHIPRLKELGLHQCQRKQGKQGQDKHKAQEKYGQAPIQQIQQQSRHGRYIRKPSKLLD